MIYNLPCKSIHISGCKLIIYFAQKNYFFYFTPHFYKTSISVHLLYTIFYINNIFLFFFNIILSPVSFSYSFSSFFFLISLCRFLFLFLPLLSSSFTSPINHQNPHHRSPIQWLLITDSHRRSKTPLQFTIHDHRSNDFVPVVDFVVDFSFLWLIFVVDFWFCVCGSVCIRGRKNIMRERMR